MAREMKDSGNARVGSIPIHWKIGRLKHVAQLYTGNSIKDDEKELYGDPIDAIPYISSKDIDATFLTANYSNGMYVKKNDLTFKIAPAGSLLMCIEGGSAGRKKTRLSQSVAFVNKLCCFNPAKINGDFLYYWICSPNFEDEFKENISGLIGGVSVSSLQNFTIALPSSTEQMRIASFLDRKCAEIDSVIADTQRTIEEYKKLKQSVITQAVTKGIRGERPMKDSGIEYCDAIPDEWSITRMAFSNWIRARLGWKGLKAEEYVDIGYPFLSAFNIINDKLVWCNLNHITQERYDESPEIKLSIGDILLVKDGAGIGKCGRIDELPLGEATVNSSLAVITPNENLYYKYEYYYFLCDAFQKVIMVLRNGMGVPHLTQEIMKGIRLPLPSKEEQIEIAEYLDTKCAEVDRIISAKEKLLKELESYKKSVIYEYVTGKKEVPACQ